MPVCIDWQNGTHFRISHSRLSLLLHFDDMRNDIIGHWYLKDLGGPFRNILDCNSEKREQIGSLLKERYDRSYFHENYLSGRDDVERQLHKLFKDRGGKPQTIYRFAFQASGGIEPI